MGKQKRAKMQKKDEQNVQETGNQEKLGDSDTEQGKIPGTPKRRTRSKRLHDGEGRDQQPLPKQIKVAKATVSKVPPNNVNSPENLSNNTLCAPRATKTLGKIAKQGDTLNSKESVETGSNNNATIAIGHVDDEIVPQNPVVGTAKSLINSIKAKKVNKATSAKRSKLAKHMSESHSEGEDFSDVERHDVVETSIHSSDDEFKNEFSGESTSSESNVESSGEGSTSGSFAQQSSDVESSEDQREVTPPRTKHRSVSRNKLKK